MLRSAVSRLAVLVLIGTSLGLTASETKESAGSSTRTSAAVGTGKAASAGKKEQRQREGTRLLDVAGRFQLSGDRVVFVPADKGDEHALRVLENLMLERVIDNLNESRSDRRWTVSGTITEYRSVNYLLLSKAIVETREAGESTR